MEPGLQVAGRAQLRSQGFPSALQPTPGSGSVVVAAGSLAGCHSVMSPVCRGRGS